MNSAKLILLHFSAIGILLSACGSSTPNQILTTDQPDTEDKLTKTPNVSVSNKADVASKLTWNNGAAKIFANNCGFCHTSWALNFALFKAKKESIILRINSKTNPMPPANTAKWLSEKARALEYLSSDEMK